MDPDANLEAALERAREIIARVDAGEGEGIDRDAVVDLAEQLAELTVALDEWLKQGGALPQAWASPAFSNGVTIAQAIALGSKLKANDTMLVTSGGAGLGPEYLYVQYRNDTFVLGIDRTGRCSS